MYNPPYNRVDDAEAVAMIASSSFGHLVSIGPEGLVATGLPFLAEAAVGGEIRLSAHFARANPHWRDLDGREALMIFQLTDAYVSPAWYPSKGEHGKVVPTWNYEVVQVHGTVTVHDDADWLRSFVSELTDRHEAERSAADSSAAAWKVTDAPADYIDKNLAAIVGIEIAVSKIEGKRKLSQNRSDADRAGVAAGLDRVGAAPAVAAAMIADLVQ
jgi:transcriptional regulator